MNSKDKYYRFSEQFLKQLPAGAFLSVKSADKLNTMTIGWGMTGFIWQKPMMLVAVRPSRYTYELIEKAQEFTVSVPLNDELKKQLATAGTKSGRDVDKFKACPVTAGKGKVVEAPVIEECGLIFECRTVYRQDMDPTQLDEAIRANCYGNNDYHTLYYGEILDCYTR